MDTLRSFSSLSAADIGNTSVTEHGVACFEHCRSLRVLALWGTDVGDGIVDVLSKIVPLEVLTLSGTRLSSDTIEKIGNLFPNTFVSHREFGDRFRGLREKMLCSNGLNRRTKRCIQARLAWFS